MIIDQSRELGLFKLIGSLNNSSLHIRVTNPWICKRVKALDW